MKYIKTILFAISLLGVSFSAAAHNSIDDHNNFERTHSQEERIENDDEKKDDSNDNIEDSYTPEELDGKDRTN